MGEILVRFAFAGIMVAISSVLGDMLEPKRFAGIFAAAATTWMVVSLAAWAGLEWLMVETHDREPD